MVRTGELSPDERIAFIALFLGHKQVGYGSKLNSSNSEWLDPIRTTRWAVQLGELSSCSDLRLDLVWYVDDRLVFLHWFTFLTFSVG